MTPLDTSPAAPAAPPPEAFAFAFDNGMHRFLSVFSGVLTVALAVCTLLLVPVMPPIAVLVAGLVWALGRLFVATALHHRAMLVVGREGVGSAETGILLPWSALQRVRSYTSMSGRGVRYRMIEFRLRDDADESLRHAAAALNRALPTMTLFRRSTIVSLCTDTLRDDGEAVLLMAVRRFAPHLAEGERFRMAAEAGAPPGSLARAWRDAVRTWDGLPEEPPPHPVDAALGRVVARWRPYHFDLLDREALPEAGRAEAVAAATEHGIGDLVGMILLRRRSNGPRILLGRSGLAVIGGKGTAAALPWDAVADRLERSVEGISIHGVRVLAGHESPGSTKALTETLGRLARVALHPEEPTPDPPADLVLKGTPAAVLAGVKAMVGLLLLASALVLGLQGLAALIRWMSG